MSKTLSLSPRAHLFIKDGALWLKLQKPNQYQPSKPDFYIIKKFGINQLREIHEWTGKALEEIEENK